jgi:predicted nucleotidyltransferase
MEQMLAALAAQDHVGRIADAFPYDWPLRRHLLVAGYMGSQSHGTYMPSSHTGGYDDVDIMGVIVPPKRYFIGLSGFDHWMLMKDELDVVTYSVTKLARLLLKGNPNVLGLLWLRSDRLLASSPMWEQWRMARHSFLSQRVRAAFAGYAHDQLVKLGRPNTRGYMGAERKALFAKHGYDIKNAAHCVRLLRMGLELLETGELHVDRTRIDADELNAIKRGEYSLERIHRIAADGFRRMEAASARNLLPPEPDSAVAERLVIATVEWTWENS